MTFFFDRTLGVKIPEALQTMNLPVAIAYHQEYFEMDAQDDYWLNVVGPWNWVVVSQDYSYHLKETELAALRQHNIGCFYLWGSEAGRWETMRVFAKAYDKMINQVAVAVRPFVFNVDKNGALREEQL